MKTNLRLLMTLLLAGLLGACGKLDAPAPGTYRAYVKVRGGEVPFVLQVSESAGNTVLGIVHDGELQAATSMQMQDGTLQAELPDGAGAIHADISRQELKGELRLTDPHGKPQVLAFAADLNETYRFIETPSTDNADISGYWQLEAISPEHFSAPVTVQLQQRFDGVEGELVLPDGQRLPLLGQVNGEEVYLSGLGHGRALLLKGKVGEHGELQGELWTNLSNAQRWAAKRMKEEEAAALAEDHEPLRQVAFPWAIPTQ